MPGQREAESLTDFGLVSDDNDVSIAAIPAFGPVSDLKVGLWPAAWRQSLINQGFLAQRVSGLAGPQRGAADDHQAVRHAAMQPARDAVGMPTTACAQWAPQIRLRVVERITRIGMTPKNEFHVRLSRFAEVGRPKSVPRGECSLLNLTNP